jgi:hypothetical protein
MLQLGDKLVPYGGGCYGLYSYGDGTNREQDEGIQGSGAGL